MVSVKGEGERVLEQIGKYQSITMISGVGKVLELLLIFRDKTIIVIMEIAEKPLKAMLLKKNGQIRF